MGICIQKIAYVAFMEKNHRKTVKE